MSKLDTIREIIQNTEGDRSHSQHMRDKSNLCKVILILGNDYLDHDERTLVEIAAMTPAWWTIKEYHERGIEIPSKIELLQLLLFIFYACGYDVHEVILSEQARISFPTHAQRNQYVL
ncbi:MAG: hypothetical protein AB7F19_07550 [Candidatus Babeliales bacterium]